MRPLHIVMPLGGLGSRFSSNGYTEPKPLIEVDKQPMLMKALSCFNSLDCEKKYTFIVRYDHIEKFNILNKIKSYVPTANFAILMSNTRGAVETCLKAEEFIDEKDGVVILDCDLEFYSADYFSGICEDLKKDVPDVAGRLVSFTSNDPRYSYARLGEDFTVIQTAEKNPISEHALAGSYFFSTKKIFINAANSLINDFNNGVIKTKELYLSLLFNYIIKDGGVIKLSKLTYYNSFGTPEELERYLKKKNIKISGHSGCKIELENNEIMKSTTDKEYIHRLRNQIVKQIDFKKILRRSQTYFNVPEIYDVQEDADHFTASMEFINGKSCIEYFDNCSSIAVSNFISEVINFINFELSESKKEDVSRRLIEKFDSTVSNIIRNFLNDSEILELIEFYKKNVFNDNLKCKVPVGICHGDMTLSNMIFCDNEVYMIDFLDSFIETPLMDIVKLRQDTKYNWSYLLVNDTENMSFENSRSNFYKIDCEIFDYYSKKDFFKEGYFVFQVLNFFRILQYARKESIIKYLKMILKDLEKEIIL